MSSDVSSRHKLGYLPALDGLRAVAVVGVLLYHARFAWIPGGFLGVSTFFTLSGFLITSLLLTEHEKHHTVNLRGFFSRRFRRLLPASWMVMLLVVVMGITGVWTTAQLHSLRGDVPWALAELVNWHFIAEGRDYAALFTAPSPLEHYWSLAIEQQFYLLLPLLVVGVLKVNRQQASRLERWSYKANSQMSSSLKSPPAQKNTSRKVGRLALVLAFLAVGSMILSGMFSAGSIPRAYFGTDTRLAELAVGALLACVGKRQLTASTPDRGLAVELVGLSGLAVTFGLWSTATVSDQWLYPWGLGLTALASGTIIVGALQGGLLARVLSLAPVVALGRISYGVYLLHWPVFLWLNQSRTGLSQWPLFAVRVAVTLGAATVMYHLLERPIRERKRLTGRWAKLVPVPFAGMLVGLTLLSTSSLPNATTLKDGEENDITIPPTPLQVLVVGDELAASLEGFEGTNQQPLEVTVASVPTCGIVLGGFVQLQDGQVERDIDRCGLAKQAWLSQIKETSPDVVLVWSGLRDVTNRRLDTVGAWLAPGDEALDDFLDLEVASLVQDIEALAVPVVFATVPPLNNTATPPPPVDAVLPPDPVRVKLLYKAWTDARADAPPVSFPENDPQRTSHWNELLAHTSGVTGATVVDLAQAIGAFPVGPFDKQRRSSDGIGVTPAGQEALAELLAESLSTATLAKAPAKAPSSALSVPMPEKPTPTPRQTTPPGEKVSMLVVGDSVSFTLGVGLKNWADETGQATVFPVGQFGCPIARGGQFRFLRDVDVFKDRCDWEGFFPKWVDDQRPDVVILMSGIWEVVDRRLPGDDRFRHLGDPVVDQYILSEFLAAVDVLASRGATVGVVTYPRFEPGRDQGYSNLDEADEARVVRLNEILAEVVAQRSEVAQLVDLRGWLQAQPGGELDLSKREDGLHFTDEYSLTVGRWLGPKMVDLARGDPPE